MAEEFAGGGVDDADVEVGDEDDDVGSGVFSADADVVQAAVVAQRDLAGGIDSVVADPVMRVVVAGHVRLGPSLEHNRGDDQPVLRHPRTRPPNRFL